MDFFMNFPMDKIKISKIPLHSLTFCRNIALSNGETDSHGQFANWPQNDNLKVNTVIPNQFSNW